MISSLVIDNGSGIIKAGFSGDDAPKAVFPNIIGRPLASDTALCSNTKEFYIGDEAQAKRSLLKTISPIENGIVTNWDDMERIFHHTFYNELRVSPEEHPILLTQVPLNPIHNYEKLAQIMFDTFNVPAIYIAITSVLYLYSSGNTTGLVFESGHDVTSAVPIYEGYIVPLTIERMNFAGKGITTSLAKMITERGYYLNNSVERESVKDIKEKLCYVALDYNEEIYKSRISRDIEKSYELPDGNNLTIGSQRFRAPELFFQPHLRGQDIDSVDEMVYKSIMNCRQDIRRDLFNNVVLCGGSTMFPGFGERLNKELVDKVQPSLRVRVKSPIERKFSVWNGGSILSSLSSFQSMWIAKYMYEEEGPRILNKLGI